MNGIWRYLREEKNENEVELCCSAFIARDVSSRGFDAHQKGSVGDSGRIYMLEKDGINMLLGVVVSFDGNKEPDYSVAPGKSMTGEGMMSLSMKELADEENVLAMVAVVTVSRDFETEPGSAAFYKIQRVDWSLV